jgi:hypothetical protein
MCCVFMFIFMLYLHQENLGETLDKEVQVFWIQWDLRREWLVVDCLVHINSPRRDGSLML